MRLFDPQNSALVGHTGFVGSNLLAGFPFGSLYNSSNVEEIGGKSFDLLVFSGAQARKWWANQKPDEDWVGLQRALAALSGITAKQIVLISTVDVLPDVCGADEESPVEGRPNHAYGANRWRLEKTFRQRFGNLLVIRLPALFGRNLRKNVIYDLMNDNNLGQIDARGTFQYFWLSRLWDIIETSLNAGLPLLHVATEPVSTGEIVDRFFPGAPVKSGQGTAARYDVRTRHDALFGGTGGYIQSKDQVLDDLAAYFAEQRRS